MSDPTLITPDEIEDLAIVVVRERHPEHLAAHERRRGLQPETLERLKTVDHLSATGARLASDTPPCVLIGSGGTAGEAPRQNEDGTLDVALQLAMEVTVEGQGTRGARDTQRRRDWTAWTVIECLLQRLPRDGIVRSIELQDVENVDEGDAQRVLASVRVIFLVWVPSMVSVTGPPVHEDPHWPPGTPGGPPPDDEPYTPPVPIPEPEEFRPSIDREAIS